MQQLVCCFMTLVCFVVEFLPILSQLGYFKKKSYKENVPLLGAKILEFQENLFLSF